FLADVVESCEEAIITNAPSGEILTWNHGAEVIYGYSADEAIGKPFSMIIAPERRARADLLIGQLLAGALLLQDDGLALRKDGNKVHVTVTNWPIRNSAGEVTAICSIVRDVSVRHEAEKNRALLASVVESSSDAVHAVNLDGTVVSWNQGAEALFGYTNEEIIGKNIAMLAPDDRGQEVPSFMAVIAQGGLIGPFDTFLRSKDGRDIDVSLSISPIRNSDGEVVGASAIARDISQRKRAEAALRDSEERYRATFEQAPVGIVHTSFGGKIEKCNARFAEIIGYPDGEVPGMTFEQLSPPEDMPRSRAELQPLSTGEAGSVSWEKRYIRKDGSLTWVKVTATIRRDSDRREQNHFVIVEDINARKEAEELLAAAAEALRLSEERYRTIFQISLDCISITQQSDGRVVDVNQEFLRMFGYEREEVIGRTTTELNIWTDPKDRLELVEAMRKDSVIRDLEFLLARKNGQRFWVLASGALIELNGIPSFLIVVRDISAARAAAEALRLSEERYRATFQLNLDAIDICNLEDGKFIEVNEAFLKVTGFKRDEVIGHTALEIGIWANSAERQKLVEEIRKNAVCRNFETQYRTREGTLRWGVLSVSQIEIGGVACILSITRDITDAKAAEERLAAAAEALRLSEERYRTAFQTSLDAISIIRLSDTMFIDVNQSLLDIMGFERDEVLGKTSQELGIWADDRDRQAMVEIVRQNSGFRALEARFRKKNGEIVWGEVSASIIEIDGVACVLTITRDITPAKVAENTIRNLAFYDPLTGLLNRRQLLEQLRQTLAAGARSGRLRALLLIDLDNFKALKETLGYRIVDLLLKEVARRIAACAHEADTVYRLGGDQFVMILEGLSKVAEEAAAQAEVVGERILAAVGRPYPIEGRECLATICLGVTVFGDRLNSTDEIMQQADIALHQAKAAGDGLLRFFSPALQTSVNARATLEEELRQGIKAKQFQLYYQPQVERGRVTGAEALIRWNHPRRGLVLPDEFIPLAEESRLILPLGDWIMEAACAQIAAWAGREQTARLMLSVNISALQFRQPEFVEHVLMALDRTGANPKSLRLELTESMLVENIEEIIAKMAELKFHGLRFSMDDFGTGYSSLAYLKRLPLDQLKIDRAFVRDILVDSSSGAIAQTIISLGRAMDMLVIAEGVETEEQRGFLAGLGCHNFQGFLFSHPLPLEQFEAFLQSSA
ncbi:MAG: PAS domain S-box protein, partial [Terracidiphilus sp.]